MLPDLHDRLRVTRSETTCRGGRMAMAGLRREAAGQQSTCSVHASSGVLVRRRKSETARERGRERGRRWKGKRNETSRPPTAKQGGKGEEGARRRRMRKQSREQEVKPKEYRK